MWLGYDWLFEVGFMAKPIYSVPKSLAVQHSKPETDVRVHSCGPSSFPGCFERDIWVPRCLHPKAVIMEILALAGGLKTSRERRSTVCGWLQAQMCRLSTAQPQGAPGGATPVSLKRVVPVEDAGRRKGPPGGWIPCSSSILRKQSLSQHSLHQMLL